MELNTYEDWYGWALDWFAGDERRARLAARAAMENKSVGAGQDAIRYAAVAAGSQPLPEPDASPAASPPPQTSPPVSSPAVTPVPFPPLPLDPVPPALPPPPPATPTPPVAFVIRPTPIQSPPIQPPAAPDPPPSWPAEPGASTMPVRPPRPEWQDPRVVVAAGVLLLLALITGFIALQRLNPTPSSASRAAPGAGAPQSPPSGSPSAGAAAAPAGCPAGMAKFASSAGCYTPGPNVGLPGPIPGVTMTYYDISGSNADEVVSQLTQKSPGCYGAEAPVAGRSFCPASTRVKGSVTIEQKVDANCIVRTANARFTVEVIVPRWTPGPGTPPELVGSWRRYLTGIYEYQKGYYDILAKVLTTDANSLLGKKCLNSQTLSDLTQQADGEALNQQQAYGQSTKLGATLVPAFP